MDTRRWSSRLATGVVAIIAAIASYSHMRSLALDHGQDHLIATLLPLSADGLTVVGAVAIADGRRHTWSAWAAFVLGVAASLAANILAARPDLISRAISAWPAVALLAVVEVLSRSTPRRSGRRYARDDAPDATSTVGEALTAGQESPQVTPAADVTETVTTDGPQAPAGDDADDIRTRTIAAVLIGGRSYDEASAAAGVTPRTVRRWVDDAQRAAAERSRRSRGGGRSGQRQDGEPVSAPPAAPDDPGPVPTAGPDEQSAPPTAPLVGATTKE